MTRSPHRPLLEALALPPGTEEPLAQYLDLLAAWNPRVNLTGARTPSERVAVLVEPVLPALGLLGEGPLLDVGSGNGSPGLVLALLRPKMRATLLEPRARRWAFLREAARRAGRLGLDVLRQRHDQYRGSPALNVTIRALALPLAELQPLALEGGRLFVFGGGASAPGPFWVQEGGPPFPGSKIQVFRRACFT